MYQKRYYSNQSKQNTPSNTKRAYKSPLSPKYDLQQALQNKQERQRINEQKLTRFNDYNNFLATRAFQDYYSGVRHIKSPAKKNSHHLKDTHQNYWKTKNFDKQQLQLLDSLKSKNQQLTSQNRSLKSQLSNLDQGSLQLSQILQQVQSKYSLLKARAGSRVQGLWMLSQPNKVSFEEKVTRETIQFQSEKGLPGKNGQGAYVSFFGGNDEKEISVLQNKFGKLLNKLQNRFDKSKEEKIIQELNRIENQLDWIKSSNIGQFSKRQISVTSLAKANNHKRFG